MSSANDHATRSEAVGVFDDAAALQDAIDDLTSSGFSQRDLSLLAGERVVQEKLGHLYRKVSELEDDLSVPRTAYVSPETRGDAEGGIVGGLIYVGAVAAAGAVVATGGTLAAIIAAAAAAGGTGGLVGAALARMIEDHHAHYLQEQLDKGGLLLWVRTWDEEREGLAREILSRHSAHDVHVHSFPGEKTSGSDGSVQRRPEG